MIEIRGFCKTYQMGDVEVRALRDVDLSVEAGDFVAIMGASGSGKSTLLQLLGLLDTPTSGSYRLDGREVANLTQDEMAGVRSRTLGFIFQQFNLLSRTSALENTALPHLYSEAAAGADPADLLRQVGLGERMHHKPNELSGGQQQRVAIARALVNKPRVVLADEPTGNLDSHSSEEIIQILEGLNEQGITIVMVTHEPDIAAHARRIIHMKDGRIQSDERLKTVPPRPSVASTESSAVAEGVRGLGKDRTFSYLKQAVRSLVSNKVRTGLSILGILIGVMAVIAMQAIGTGAKKSMEAQMSSLGSNLLMLRPGSRNVGGVSTGSDAGSRLSLEDVDAIRNSLSYIKNTAPEVNGRVQVVYQDANWSTQATGTTPPYAAIRNSAPMEGRFFTDQEVQRRDKVVLLGMTVVKQLFPDGQNPIGATVKINRVAFQVIGVLPAKGANGFRDQDDTLIVPVTTAMYRLMGKQYIDMIDIEVDQAENIKPVTDSLTQLMRKRHRLQDGADDDFQIRNMADIQSTMTSLTNTITLFLTIVAGISLFVGGIGIMNIMLVSVTERTREIGLRKALGARGKDILSQFLLESVVVSLVGGVLGILLGVGGTLAVTQFTGWGASFTPGSVILAVVFSGVIGVAFGLWPAKKAAALDPIVALRYE